MRRNEPVTDIEVPLSDGTMIVSTTDLKGTIQYVNRDFIDISGYTEAELIGQPHNLIRHPDMPPEAFADLWATLKSGKPWTGLVKNRCKNGDHYWVEANATPLRQNGEVIGFMSVRRKPARDKVEAAERTYRAFRDGKAAGLRIHSGEVVSDGTLASLLRRFRYLPLQTGAAALATTVAVLTAGALFLYSRGLGPALLLPGVVIPTYLAARLILGQARTSISAIRERVQDLAEGRMNSGAVAVTGGELVQLLDRVRSLEIKLGFDLSDSRRRAEEATRIKVGLDNVATNIMIAGTDGVIIYLNEAIKRMFSEAEADIRKDLPSFSAAGLIGANIDVFHRHPQHQRNLLARLTGTHRAEIRIGGHVFSLAVTPVLDADGDCLGTAVEWQDRTAEVAIEDQVAKVIQAAAAGDLGQRVSVSSRQRFIQVLSDSINQLLATNEEVIGSAATALSAVAAGDLTATMNGQYQGTFAELQRDLNRTVERLRGMVGEITEAVSQIHTGATEISRGNADLSQRTEQQAAHLEETAASAEQLTATVRRNSEHTQQAQQLVTQARSLANDSGETVAQVVQTMKAIDASSGKIADIVSLIDGIAFQTNILALNAAVEAARAGEQGRGFAVVASEVRSLAQRCAAAAKDVKALIDESTSQVGTGTIQVDQAGDKIKELVQAVRSIADLMGEIGSATREQAAGVDQVARTITEVDETTQRNAALVEQASAAAENVEDQALRLNQLVSQFRLQASPARQGSRDIAASADKGHRAARLRR